MTVAVQSRTNTETELVIPMIRSVDRFDSEE